ncbi:MAG: hypothetical protein KIS92_01340 [Planctomycetota bacterium]|nr:hypothetical protein [Planctomycetota bacterium]
MRTAAAVLLALVLTHAWAAEQVPLRVEVTDGGEAVPVTGGIPFPKGALDSVEHVRLLGADKKEIPCQVAKHAVWPDGSVKWALIDAVLTPKEGQNLMLEYGAGVARAAVNDPMAVALNGADARVTGGGVTASINKNGQGVVDELAIGGKTVVAAGKPARLVVETSRIDDGTSGRAFPFNRFLCADPEAKRETGAVQIESISVEAPGPVRATVLVRGFLLLPSFGATLPKEVKDREPAGRMPFSMRLSFYRGSAIVTGQHQIIFSGEPDCDFIQRWGIEWPGCAGTSGTLVLEPGVELRGVPGAMKVAPEPSRLCWAPVQGGFALIRQGWQHRPCAITQENGSAWIDFWPRAAGAWDLRRYAREWAVGESGDLRNPDDLLRFAKYAARGMAKSHDFAMHFGSAAQPGPAPAAVKELSERALLVAPPGWYAKTEALGPIAPKQETGAYAALDAEITRRADYYLYCQDLYRWHGKLVYGFFQSRFGEVHRHDRWDNDYGRWGWALNDGAGRFGHVLMLQFLRTLDRRYFDAGEAFGRINYDTNMVHTVQHLENCKGWWTATGASHRHNVQPFGCPYVGMRGSYPVGQRIQHLLTGDGVMADGLDLVADASFRYASGEGSRLCNSGGSDGQGSASNALLWKYETTGDKKYLDACRKILDLSGLVPPKEGKGLGYGPSFGLFNAAGEYADLSGDKAFQDRVVELARQGAKDKNATTFAYAIAMGARFSKDEALKAKLEEMLKKEAASEGRGLAELPAKDWPGHGGFRTPEFPANLYRDVPTGLGVLVGPGNLEWPKAAAGSPPAPALPPADWYKPGGAQAAGERVPAAKELLALKPGEKPGDLSGGGVTWPAQKALADDMEVGGAHPLAAPIEGYVMLDNGKLETLRAEVTGIGAGAHGGVIATAKAGPATLVFKLAPAQADGVASVRVEAACQVPQGSGRVASWGLKIPCKLSGKGTAVMSTAPGRFRLERCRLDQNDEKIPSWLSAMEGREKLPHWPLWREAGIQAGPGLHYRIWHANRADTSPVYVDQGEGPCAWFDLTDRGGAQRWGVTARVLRAEATAADLSRLAVRANMETGVLLVQFHDEAAEPQSEAAGAAGLSGACDLIFHDGWRPPLSKPELTQAQYDRFIDDANIGESYGLNALRFTLSDTHKVKGREWMVKIRDLGVEPRELLYGMQGGDVLSTLCQKAGVAFDANDVEGTVKRVVEHYRK